MEKLYRVKMNENGMPNFSTAEEVEPKHGEWIYPSDVSGFGRCENCNALWGKDLIDNIFFIHCPRCGAKMKGADDANR